MTTSTAWLTKYTEMDIVGAAGSALSITAITKAKPAVVTATNTLAVGDVVLFGVVTNMPEINGRLGVVTVASGSSFTVNIDASGFASAGTTGAGTPYSSWTKIANVKDFNGFTGAVSEVDKSHLQSDAKEFAPGLEDFGSVTFNCDFDPTDPGQIALMSAKSNSLTTIFRLKYTSASVYRAWQGFVKKFDEAAQVDGVYRSAGEIRCTGRVSRQEVVI